MSLVDASRVVKLRAVQGEVQLVVSDSISKVMMLLARKLLEVSYSWTSGVKLGNAHICRSSQQARI